MEELKWIILMVIFSGCGSIDQASKVVNKVQSSDATPTSGTLGSNFEDTCNQPQEREYQTPGTPLNDVTAVLMIDRGEITNCGAVFISPTVAITAAHCVSGLEADKITVIIPASANRQVTSASPEKIYIDPNHSAADGTIDPEFIQNDLAALKFDTELVQQGAMVSNQKPSNGATFSFFGFELNESISQWQDGGQLQQHQFVNVSEDVLTVNNRCGLELVGGNSGGPVFVDGQLVGIASGVLHTKNSAWSFFAPLHTENAQAVIQHFN